MFRMNHPSRAAQNILFIMCDQLRWDYLSCYGHPHLTTPNIDRLAARGMRFDRAYVQSPICGPARMCCYTGRYMSSHGALWNGDPLPLSEIGFGEFLADAGMRTLLVGKTHAAPDRDGMARLGVDPASRAGVLAAQCGFEPYERDDGLHPDPIVDPNLRYNQYLRAMGYEEANPWDRHANGAVDDAGGHLSGWLLRHARKPAAVAAEHSETAYMTDRAMACIREMGDAAWCIHLSYIKPHWPYIAPAPYHKLYGDDAVLPAVRNAAERADPHPVYAAFMDARYSRVFADEQVRRDVVGAYMGLVKQIDDQIGRLLAFLEEGGYMENTLLVFTSDHGDYLGDHWLGEKDLFHEPSVRVPLIIYDPSPAADATRGAVETRLVESIDLAPTFLDVVGAPPQAHRLEGRSLLPLLHGAPPPDWRDATFSEIDYAGRPPRETLGLAFEDCRAYMVRTDRWKYILHERFRPQLFDLRHDPDEFVDLGADPGYTSVRAELHERLFTWLRRRKRGITMPLDRLPDRRSDAQDRELGILIGYW